MRIIKYYEHSVNPGEVVPLRIRALEKIIADSVCNLLNDTYSGYGNNVIEIEFRRADVNYVYCNCRREADFALALHRNNGQIDDIFVTINYNTNELISVESNVGSAFNHSLFKALSERLMKNEREKKGMKIKISFDEFESICKKACCEYFNDKPKADQYCYATNTRDIDTSKMILKVGLSFIPNNVQKLKRNVLFIFNGISGDIDYSAFPSLPAGTGDAICGIICRMIRSQCSEITYNIPLVCDADGDTPVVRYCLNDVMILHNYISEEEKNMIEGKKYINRADVYKTMTDDQKIVMQDAIANAVESTIKDCRMEYENVLKALGLKIENYKGLINSIYGSDGMLSKLNKLKNSLEVQKIIINEPAMIVFWKDGTKTVVTATDEAFDEEKGLAMAFAKKALGNNYAAGGRFKAKLKHAERVKRKEETVENDISKVPICKEIMDEAMRRVKAENDIQKEKPTSGRYPWGEDKRLKKSEFVKQMLDAGFTKDEADAMWKGYKER